MGLPRVAKVLGCLQGLQPANLLDVGTGRGVFLHPLLDTFPGLPVTCVDVLPHRVAALRAMSKGGLDQLEAYQLDAGQLTFADNQFAVVTALEVLEHLPNLEQAIEQVCRVADAYVILSVPSREDDNPEHIHLLDPDQLRELFSRYGFGRMKFTHVLNHRIALAQPGWYTAYHATDFKISADPSSGILPPATGRRGPKGNPLFGYCRSLSGSGGEDGWLQLGYQLCRGREPASPEPGALPQRRCTGATFFLVQAMGPCLPGSIIRPPGFPLFNVR